MLQISHLKTFTGNLQVCIISCTGILPPVYMNLVKILLEPDEIQSLTCYLKPPATRQ